MEAREKAALKRKMIKVFMSQEELAIILGSLNWVTVELGYASDNLEKLSLLKAETTNNILLSGLVSDQFRVLLPALRAIYEHPIMECVSDFEEKREDRGLDACRRELSEWDVKMKDFQIKKSAVAFVCAQNRIT